MIRNIFGYSYIVGALIYSLFGAIALFNGYTKLAVISDLKKDRALADAEITSDVRSGIPVVGDPIFIDLNWYDADGTLHQSNRVGVDARTADQIQFDGELFSRDIEILYSPSSKSPRPIIAQNTKYQEDTARVRLYVGAPLVLSGLFVLGILVYFQRRRKT